jgi:16S rRNA (cytidine1402-2'-O)-methyltransferase
MKFYGTLKSFFTSSTYLLCSSTILQDTHKCVIVPGRVYFIATPIGNTNDISKRAIEMLSQADIICAEDTRHTRNLLNLLKIVPKRLISHHEHNYMEQIPKLIKHASEGKSIAVVSDAGTPGISDPGAQLAKACFENNIVLHPIPGPSAVIASLSVSGFPSSEFTFFGFIPVKGKERSIKMNSIVNCKHTVVIFEAPHRLIETLSELSENYKLSERDCVCCREITKLNEELYKGTVSECLKHFQERLNLNEKVF